MWGYWTSTLDGVEWSTASPVLLYPGKEPVRALAQFNMLWWKGKFLGCAEIRTTDRPAFSLIAIQAALSRLCGMHLLAMY